jgi:hypothetical protein
MASRNSSEIHTASIIRDTINIGKSIQYVSKYCHVIKGL